MRHSFLHWIITSEFQNLHVGFPIKKCFLGAAGRPCAVRTSEQHQRCERQYIVDLSAAAGNRRGCATARQATATIPGWARRRSRPTVIAVYLGSSVGRCCRLVHARRLGSLFGKSDEPKLDVGVLVGQVMRR